MMGQEIVNYDKAWADAAQHFASEEKLEGNFISTKSGVLSFGEEELPGNQMCVVILDSVRENTFYGSKFDPDSPSSPLCYAFGRTKNDDMAPHESMAQHLDYFQPQAESCGTCPNNEWGTSDTGRGKACQQRRRLALIPAGYYAPRPKSRDFDLHFFDEEKAFRDAEVAFMKLPTTSIKEWAKYVNQLNASVRRPPYGVITRIFLEPDTKHQFHVKFEMLEILPDELFTTITARMQEAQQSIITAYSPPREETEAPRQNGLRPLRGRK